MTVTTMSAAAIGLATASLAVYGNLRLRRRLCAARGALAQARYAATHDPLTGLANRAGIDRDLATRAGAGDTFAVLLVDLDEFKPVNDIHGHAAGDAVLVEVARRLEDRVVSDGDLAGRFGGDEFVILADCAYGALTMMLARDVLAVLREPIDVGGVRVQVTASVGCVQVLPGDHPRAALHSADVALYRAKADGGDTAIEFGPAEPLAVASDRPRERLRDAHPHRVPVQAAGVVIVR